MYLLLSSPILISRMNTSRNAGILSIYFYLRSPQSFLFLLDPPPQKKKQQPHKMPGSSSKRHSRTLLTSQRTRVSNHHPFPQRYPNNSEKSMKMRISCTYYRYIYIYHISPQTRGIPENKNGSWNCMAFVLRAFHLDSTIRIFFVDSGSGIPFGGNSPPFGRRGWDFLGRIFFRR